MADTKWNLIVDVAECINCQLCALATQDEHVGNAYPGYAEEMPKHGRRWIEIERRERGAAPHLDVAYLPRLCQHCDDAPCMKAAKDGAITKRTDGIVLIDPVKAKGQKQLVDACPYGAITWNEEKQVPQAWFFDAHLLDSGWQAPRCVSVCATEALEAVKCDDAAMAVRVAAEDLEELRPELGTKPRVRYKNLWRFTTAFVAGSVAAEDERGIVDCLEGALVRLTRDGETQAETVTDAFGDFRFDRLEPDGARYTVAIAAAGHEAHSLDVALSDSVSLGEIRLIAAG
ncbi:MAG: 4Fe-4S dicluster domain-containing protein [Alphaproteobacteria bacterium]|jgi:Fe-S-cluster-containing dehydrogenase component